MIKGVTPIDTAFEIVGLCNAQQLTHYIFFETAAGMLIFAVGFIFSLYAVSQKGSFKPFFTFLVLFFTVWILFVVPTTRIETPMSTMEQNGFGDITSQKILNNNPLLLNKSNTSAINPVLNIFSDVFSAFAIGCVSVIERGADPGKSNYLKNPFMVTKLSTLASQTFSEGIKNPQLRKEVTNFYKDYYLPILRKLIEDRAYTVADMPKLWPGDQSITTLYTPEASTAWATVKKDILTNLQQQSPIQNKPFIQVLSELLGQSTEDVENQALISIFSSDIKSHPKDYAYNSYQNIGYAYSSPSSGKFWGTFMGDTLATAGANLFQPIAVSISQSMVHMAPYIQGYSLLLMFSFFPFILVIILLERKPALLVEFLKNLFWIKSWSISWAIVDVASSYVLTIQQLFNKTDSGIPEFWEGAYFNIVTSVFIIMLPILSRMMIDGIATGIGVAATAANIHADKSVDFGFREGTGSITKAGPAIKDISKRAAGIRNIFPKKP